MFLWHTWRDSQLVNVFCSSVTCEDMAVYMKTHCRLTDRKPGNSFSISNRHIEVYMLIIIISRNITFGATLEKCASPLQ